MVSRLARGSVSGSVVNSTVTLGDGGCAIPMRSSINVLQDYMVAEYVADYREGHLSRRDLIRRVLNITGGIGSTATMLLVLGCSQQAAAPTAAPAAAPTAAPKPTTAPATSPVAASPAASPSAAAAAKPVAS